MSNLITSGIARMNRSLHGVEDFRIIRGDPLADPRPFGQPAFGTGAGKPMAAPSCGG